MYPIYDDKSWLGKYALTETAQGGSLSGSAQPELLLKGGMSAQALTLDAYWPTDKNWSDDAEYLFDEASYFCSKLAQLQRDDPNGGWNVDTLTTALKDAGLTLRQHFDLYGEAESINFNNLFNNEEYLINKTKQVYGVVNAENRQATLDAITDAGMTLWQHYEQYGWLEDVDPSAGFDASMYMDDKVAQMRVTGSAGYDTTQLTADLKAAGYNPLTHLARYGNAENLFAKGKAVLYESNFTATGTEKVFLQNFNNTTKDMYFKENTDANGNMTVGFVYNKVVDAEKTTLNTANPPHDDGMCWAATACNMLKTAGWLNDSPRHDTLGINMTNEDQAFNAFKHDFLFGSRGSQTIFGLTWFADKTYEGTNNPASDQPAPGSGGFLNTSFAGYARISLGSTMDNMKQLASTLEKGGSVGLSIYTADGAAGHGITCYGYTVNTQVDPSKPGYYTGLIIADSDNSRFYDDPTQAANSLNYITLNWDAGANGYTSSFMGMPKIGLMTYLDPNPLYIV